MCLAIRNMLNLALKAVCVFFFAVMVIMGTYQILTRYFLNSPSTVSEEIVTYSFTWLSILSAGLVFGSRGHLCMAFVYNRFKGRMRVCLDILSELLVILTAILLLIRGGMVMTLQNMNQVTPSLGINMGLVYGVLPLTGIIVCVYGVLNIIDFIKLFRDPAVANYGVETWE